MPRMAGDVLQNEKIRGQVDELWLPWVTKKCPGCSAHLIKVFSARHSPIILHLCSLWALLNSPLEQLFPAELFLNQHIQNFEENTPKFFQPSCFQIWATSHAIRWVQSYSRCVLRTHVMEIWIKGVLMGFIWLNGVSAVETPPWQAPFPSDGE